MLFETFIYKIKKRENRIYSKLKDIILFIVYIDIVPIKFIFKPMNEVLIAWRFIVPLIIEKMIHVPVFKARCDKCGRGLSLINGIPWIEGHLKIQIGDEVQIDSNIFSSNFRNKAPMLKIGSRTHLGYKVSINVGEYVEIGDDCLIAGGCSIQDNDGHPISPYRRMKKEPPSTSEIKPVIIGNNVWIGTGSVILKGVTIGDGSIVAANSLVNRNVPPYSIVMGVPARIVISGIDEIYHKDKETKQ
jgi:acetyltransferase-like isoleucine patch superfamily enzyme